jgi:hypothetical protein
MRETNASVLSFMPSIPTVRTEWLQPFQSCFTPAVWRHVLVLVAGAVLAPGRRTVAAALRVMGEEHSTSFALHHRVLSLSRWSARAVARQLLLLLVAAFVPHGPVVIGLDDTIERRWGMKIKARGIYRDPVRSSHGHFVKTSGLRWLSAMLLVPVPLAAHVFWALPFLTVLCPSERYSAEHRMRHKKLTDWARQMLLQIARWLPGKQIIVAPDTSFSAIELLRDTGRHVTMITRLRLDAGLFEPPPERRLGTKGRPPVKGARLPSLTKRLSDPATAWQRIEVSNWYGRTKRRLDLASGTALWHHPGKQLAIRWLLVRDPTGQKEPQAFLSTDLSVDPVEMLGWFVRRWRIEVTFEEARHLGMETQRQWSDRAIARTTPALLGLFSLVTLWATRLASDRGLPRDHVRWYPKQSATFSDALALVRRELWTSLSFATSGHDRDVQKIPADIFDRLMLVACRPP